MEESNILVAIRVRPLNLKEQQAEDCDVVRVEDNLIVILDPVQMEYQAENKKMLDVYHRSKEQRYAFDKIFRDESQEEIYEHTCKHLIKPVMSGYNATVFAYGPTGTGKTYTMLGNQEVMGLSVLTIQDVFEFMRKDEDNEYVANITYVEIYNESIRDLLVNQSSYLELRDDPLKGIMISGVTEYKAESTEQVMNLLHQGNRRRTTESTNANLTSSRSHAVFQIVVTARSRTKNTEIENLVGKLSLIDLAGSERGTVTENRGLRLREGAKINRSLLALANCINALGDKSKKGFFVPYRDSKLTRLLKDSLGGNCKTVMIANISPSSAQFEETINTLKYANRAKNIKTKQVANKKLVAIHIAEYKNIINDLRSEIELLKQKLYERNTNIDQADQEDEQLVNNYVGKSKSQICHCNCHRPEDNEDMKKIQENIYENFQERIQLRRALMELEEQNAMNFLEIKKRQAEIVQWRKVGDKTKVPDEIKSAARQIQTLKTSSDKNGIKKELMGLQLIENINNAKRIRDSIPKKIRSKEKRDFLELEIKNHVLELQNIELEINMQIQEKTIADLKNIIESSKKLKPMVEDPQYLQQTDAEPDIEDLLDEDDLIDMEDPDPDDEDELTELENYKDLINHQKEQQNVKLKLSPQQTENKRTNRHEDTTLNRQQRDFSAPNYRPKQRQPQPHKSNAIQQEVPDDLTINGVNMLDPPDDNETDQMSSAQSKPVRKREDSKPRTLKQQPQQAPNFLIQNTQPPLQQQPLNANKILPIIAKPQPQLQLNSQLKAPPEKQDLSLLNIKGSNMQRNNPYKIYTKPPKKK